MAVDESLRILSNLRFLDISHNQIKDLSEIEHNHKLQILRVSHNRVEHLFKGKEVMFMQECDLRFNKICTWEEIETFQDIPNIEAVLLNGNPLLNIESTWSNENHLKFYEGTGMICTDKKTMRKMERLTDGRHRENLIDDSSSDFSFSSSLIQSPLVNEIAENTESENTLHTKIGAGSCLTPVKSFPPKASKKIMVPKLPLKAILPQTHYEKRFAQLVDLINQQLGCDISPDDTQELIKEKLNQSQNRQQMSYEESLAVIQKQKDYISDLTSILNKSLSQLYDFIEENKLTKCLNISVKNLPQTLNNVFDQIRKSYKTLSSALQAENNSFIHTLKECEYSGTLSGNYVAVKVKGKLARHISHINKINAELYEDLMSSLKERHSLEKRLHIVTTLYNSLVQGQSRSSSSGRHRCQK